MWWIPQQGWWCSPAAPITASAAFYPRWNGASRSGPSRPFSAVPTWYPRTRNALPGRQTISGTAPSPVPVSVTAPAPWVWKSLPKQCPPICLPAQAWYGRRPLSQGHLQAEKRVDRHAEPASSGIKPPDTLSSLSGEQGIRGFYLLRNRAVLPRCTVSHRIIPAR